jgi:hypothetical protein
MEDPVGRTAKGAVATWPEDSLRANHPTAPYGRGSDKLDVFDCAFGAVTEGTGN